MVACLASKVVPIPFGTDPPQGPIMDEKVSTAFEKMGPGYERYLKMIRAYKESSPADIKKIVTVIQATDDGEQKYFHRECAQREVDNAEAPFFVANIVDPSDYPNISDNIKKFFGLGSSGVTTAAADTGAPTQYIIKSADEADKESAKNDCLNHRLL